MIPKQGKSTFGGKRMERGNERFEYQFGHPPTHGAFAPGRINLIGEHIDYNGGHVFPCAITFGTYAFARRRNDRRFLLYSENFPESGIQEFSLDNLSYNPRHGWANYPKGMVEAFLDRGYPVDSGAELLFYGNIPNGAGLSSSASIEMATGVLLSSLFDFPVDRIELARIGQHVENHFIGVNCGIMDPFAVAMAKTGQGILLQCDTLEYEYVPIPLEGYNIVIMNTNKRRELAGSKYNERRRECEEALAALRKRTTLHHLAELSVEAFESLQSAITDPVIRKRARHVVYENERTMLAKKALIRGDLRKFGRYLNESHISLRDDYEVTGKELDVIVEAAWNQPGVAGARMTGAGFGGCAIAIVKKEAIPSFVDRVGQEYREKTGLEADFYPVMIGEGARELFRQ